MKKNNLKYFLIEIFVTSCLMLLKKSNIKDTFSLRNLFSTQSKKYLCDKAGSRLTDKYSNGFTEERDQNTKLSEAQKSLIDFARDDSFSNIRPYFKRVAIFIVFLVICYILWIVWIVYCCCCKFGLFGDGKASNICKFICYAIAAVCNLLVIIFSIIILSFISPLFKRINGLGCSAYYILDHIRYGLSPSYPSYANEWPGISGIKGRLTYANSQISFVEI